MGRFRRNRHHHDRHGNFRRHKQFNFRSLRWILIIALLIGAYLYQAQQGLFGVVILDFLNTAVSTISYWIGVLVLCVVIYFIFDRL